MSTTTLRRTTHSNNRSGGGIIEPMEVVFSRVAAMLADGKTLVEAAAQIGVTDMTLRNWRAKKPDLWEAAIAEHNLYRPPLRERIINGFAKAAALVREEIPFDQIAQRIGVAGMTFLNWRKSFPELWSEALAEVGLCFIANPEDDDPGDKDRDLGAFFEQVYRPRRLLGKSANTVRLYWVLFRHLKRFLNRQPVIDDLNDEKTAAFLDWFKEKHAAPSTNKCLNQIMALARFATLKGYLHSIPDVAALVEPKRLPTYWTPEEIGRIINAAGQEPGKIGGIPAAKYWRAIVLVFYDTGLRAGAVWGLQRSDIDLENRTVLARAENQKQHADQQLRVAEDTAAAIKAIWGPERELLFPWDRDTGTLYNHYKRILKRAGLPCGRRDKFHRIRRTTATLGQQHGADACRQLGHSSDAVTRRHYLGQAAFVQAGDVLPRPTTEPANKSPLSTDGRL